MQKTLHILVKLGDTFFEKHAPSSKESSKR